MNKILENGRIFENTLNISAENIEELSILINEIKEKSNELNEAVDRLSKYKLKISFSVSGE